MKTLYKYLFILPLFFLSSCSWIEYFVISNLSDQPIFVTYKLSKLSADKSFGIFAPVPKIHRLNKKGQLDWGLEQKVYNQDSTWNTVQITLQPKYALIIGRLHNDNYKNSEQNFINSREFNLDFIEIEVNSEIHHISKKTFDHYFKKEKGEIKFVVN